MTREEEDRIVLTDSEVIEVKRTGTSQSMRIPAEWWKTFHALKTATLAVHIERDGYGTLFIVAEVLTNYKAEATEDGEK